MHENKMDLLKALNAMNVFLKKLVYEYENNTLVYKNDTRFVLKIIAYLFIISTKNISDLIG